jgi:hypothetical protein
MPKMWNKPDKSNNQEQMTRDELAEFVESLDHPTPLEQVLLDLPEPPDTYLRVRPWIAKASDAWLPLAISLIYDYPERWRPHERLREDWDYNLLTIFSAWAEVKPELVIPEMARLLDDPARREFALEVFAWVNSWGAWQADLPPTPYLALTPYLAPWVARAGELSDRELVNLIEALHHKYDPTRHRLLRELEASGHVRPELSEAREMLDKTLLRMQEAEQPADPGPQ